MFCASPSPPTRLASLSHSGRGGGGGRNNASPEKWHFAGRNFASNETCHANGDVNKKRRIAGALKYRCVGSLF